MQLCVGPAVVGTFPLWIDPLSLLDSWRLFCTWAPREGYEVEA